MNIRLLRCVLSCALAISFVLFPLDTFAQWRIVNRINNGYEIQSVSEQYRIIIDGNNATLLDGRQTKYKGECHVDNGKLYLGNSSSYDISGQSLYYRQYRLTKEGSSSSWSGSFSTDSDVMRYLTDRTFYSESHRMSFTYNSCKIDGYAVSGAPRISNFSSTSATIVVNPLGGGRAVYLYLNASNGTINYEGDIFRAR